MATAAGGLAFADKAGAQTKAEYTPVRRTARDYEELK